MFPITACSFLDIYEIQNNRSKNMSMQSDSNNLFKVIIIVDKHEVGRKTYYISKTLFSLTLGVFIFTHETNENHGNFRDKDNC